jgi:hypothetical protein
MNNQPIDRAGKFDDDHHDYTQVGGKVVPSRSSLTDAVLILTCFTSEEAVLATE